MTLHLQSEDTTTYCVLAPLFIYPEELEWFFAVLSGMSV
jgi:hypothetical protein